MKSLITALLVPSLLFIQLRKSAGQAPGQVIVYAKVSLEHLLDSMGAYHNKPIETMGYYVCGFEHSSIMLVIHHELAPDKKIYDWAREIWVDRQYSKTMMPCDSMFRRTITVRGILDTSSHGHLGKYKATIKDAIVQLP
ncbi:hypothetical protein A3860_37690 [Niastella vici]|uniref:Uncharacterized protein n=1 Tax=Niastella vici TaxID=1703345 RepID=A0A1V9FMB5_9BACT|nr:hypothetical protein [Niastella vici]OQP59483.1 hypothetical protein A3860_37690 [Niastella vici]